MHFIEYSEDAVQEVTHHTNHIQIQYFSGDGNREWISVLAVTGRVNTVVFSGQV